jgi:hypothetical protein
VAPALLMGRFEPAGPKLPMVLNGRQPLSNAILRVLVCLKNKK